MEHTSTFDADDLQLRNLFFGSKKFRIPRYQRTYSWGIDEISEFWEDINTDDPLYFFGSFIFSNEKEGVEYPSDIIDGQQRLLTITILLAVIRDVAKTIDTNKASIYQRHDIGIEDERGVFSYRLAPAETLEDYFLKYIQSDTEDIIDSKPNTHEEKNVKANYEFFLDKVKNEIARFPSKDAKLDVLEKLRSRIRDLIVINIQVAKEDDAYDIFETTNARGMELTVGDLLKNLIFKNIQPGHDKDVAKDLWKEITKNIEETNTELKRFIRYFWLSRYGFVQEKKLYKEIKNKIGQSDWPAFLQELKESSQIYNSILVGDKSDFADYESHCFKIFSSISAIRLMGVSQCYVLFLSILSNYNRLGFDPYRYFQLIEKFTFQYSVVCKLPGNRVEKIYSKYAVEIDSAARNLAGDKKTRKLNSIFSRLEAEIKNEAPSEILFLDSFSDISYKKSKEVIHLITYMLNEIDAFYKKGDEYQINPKTINIEHLLPQNPDKEWGLNKQDIKGYVNKLGNLTLLSKEINGRMENAVISKKLPLLKESEIAMTKNLVTLLEELDCHWDENQIALRHQTFAEIAYKEIWKL